MKKPKITVFKGKRGRWYWHLVWANGEIGASSEAYTKKHGAFKSAKKLFTCLMGKHLDWKLVVK